MKAILIIEEFPIICRGLVHLISEQPGLTVGGVVKDTRKALEAVRASQPDLVLTEVVMEGVNGIDLIKQIKAEHPDLPILVLSMYDELIYAERAMRAGARGYIKKQDPDTFIVEAVRQVLEGGIWASEEVTSHILQSLSGATEADGSPIELLSDRELAVFRMIGQGYKPRQIAEVFQFNVTTVNSYRARIKAKLNLKSSADLMRYAIEWIHESRTG